MADWEAVRARLVVHCQEHLLQFLPQLDEERKDELYADISAVDFARLARYFSKAKQSLSGSQEKKDELLKPLDSSICGSTARDTGHTARWADTGWLQAYYSSIASVGDMYTCCRYGAHRREQGGRATAGWRTRYATH